MTPEHRIAVAGETDSEHMFHFILSKHDRDASRPLREVIGESLRQIVSWSGDVGPETRLGLNVILTDGDRFVGSRWQRSLHYAEWRSVRDCELCGAPCGPREAAGDYRAVAIASEPLTDEPWREVPERSIYEITPELEVQIEAL
jgi:predicted glutamine amidotransferase